MIAPFSDYALKLQLRGAGAITIPAGTSATHSVAIDKRTIFTGAEYFREDGNVGDRVSFKVLFNGNVVSTYADQIFVSSSGRYEFYQAVLDVGYTLELTYENTGSNEAKFRYNLITHIDK